MAIALLFFPLVGEVLFEANKEDPILSIPKRAEELQTKLDSTMTTSPDQVLDAINLLKNAVYAHYQQAGFPFIVIEERIQGDDLVLKIHESKLGKIEVMGNRWSSPDLLHHWLKSAPGSSISTHRIREGVLFSNKHPFRKMQALFSPGEKPLTTDLRLMVEERSSVQVYSGVDNSGVERLGRLRWSAGFTWGNAWGLGHLLSYQYTASSNFHSFQGHSLQYTAYCSWQHTVSLSTGYSSIHATLPGVDRHSGYSILAALRYAIPLPTIRNFTHDFSLGGDFKRTNNTVESGGELDLISQNINLTQLALCYDLKWSGLGAIIHAHASIFASPGEWISDQSKRDYRSQNPGADNQWIYGKLSFDYQQALPKSWECALSTAMQWSAQPLIPSEQMGIGGNRSVRGYEERQINKDIGCTSSIEFHTPSLHFFKKELGDRLYFLGFSDFGMGTSLFPLDPIPSTQYLASAGIGARYHLPPYLSARLDWGYQLVQSSYYGGKPGLIHFSLNGAY